MPQPKFELIPIDQVDLQQRARYAETEEAKEKLADLADSIKRYGLLQPILIDQNKVLLAGWRRFSACKMLGWTEVPAYVRDRLTDAEYFEIEREENFQRLGFTWQEEVQLAIKIHTSHSIQAARESRQWTRSMTGDLLGYSRQYVDNCFLLQPYLLKDYDDSRKIYVWKHPEVAENDGITDAIREIYRKREDELLAESARRLKLTTAIAPIVSADGTVEVTEGPQTSQGSNEASADVLIADLLGEEKSKQVIPETTVDLSHTLFHGDCTTLLKQWPAECVDHIITDPPYGIDMSNLDQSSISMMDTTRVDDTHDVEANKLMFLPMMESFHHVLRSGGYCIIWCDITNWQLLTECAEHAGLKVQRWPIVWCKLHQCKNQMAHVNITKNTEIAMVLRKGNATLPSTVQSSYVLAAKEPHVSNPFAKPFLVWKYCIEAVSRPGQIILEPFAGEGSGVLANLRLQRKVLAIEKDERHFNHLLNEVKGHWTNVFKNVKYV